MAIEPAVIDIWQSSVSEAQTFSVVPDGCRDVILTTTEQGACSVHVSPLYANTLNVQMTPGMTMLGYRLAPGAFIDESRLICALTESSQDIEDKVGVYTHICPDISEILESIRHHQGRASLLAVKLGVSERTLQRHLTRHTGISPVFWMQLTRVRQSAKSIGSGCPLVDVACDWGYSDQAHLTREIKRWFGVTPGELKVRQDLLSQLHSPGY